MHSRLSRLIRRTGSPANSPYAGFHFDVAAVTPQRRIPKRTSAIPDSYVHPVGRKALLPREASETGAADVSRQPGMIASP